MSTNDLKVIRTVMSVLLTVPCLYDAYLVGPTDFIWYWSDWGVVAIVASSWFLTMAHYTPYASDY